MINIPIRSQLCLCNLGHWLVDICEIWQKVLVRELAKSAYFRSAFSESDNKLFSVEGLGTRLSLDTLTCFKLMTIWPKILSLKSILKKYIEKSIGLWIIYIYKLTPILLVVRNHAEIVKSPLIICPRLSEILIISEFLEKAACKLIIFRLFSQDLRALLTFEALQQKCGSF